MLSTKPLEKRKKLNQQKIGRHQIKSAHIKSADWIFVPSSYIADNFFCINFDAFLQPKY